MATSPRDRVCVMCAKPITPEACGFRCDCGFGFVVTHLSAPWAEIEQPQDPSYGPGPMCGFGLPIGAR